MVYGEENKLFIFMTCKTLFKSREDDSGHFCSLHMTPLHPLLHTPVYILSSVSLQRKISTPRMSLHLES